MPLLTIGYEGSEIDDFIAVLKSVNLRKLVDVRDFPSSRKLGFSKTPLKERLEREGISYVHLKELGDPREGRMAARRGDVQLFERIFRSHIDNQLADTAINLLSVESMSSSICLMCFERDHRNCHRSILCEEILNRKDITVRHLGVPKGFALKAA